MVRHGTPLVCIFVLFFGVACDARSPTSIEPDDPVHYFLYHTYEAAYGQAAEAGSEFLLTVTAADLGDVWEYAVAADTSGGRTVLALPHGDDRTIAVALVGPRGDTTHDGSNVQPVHPGVRVAVPLEARTPGAAPVWVNLAQHAVQLEGLEGGVLELAHTARLTATVHRADASVMADAAIEWASTRPEVAYVDSAGRVRGNGTGTATIVAVHDGVAASRGVQVKTGAQMVRDTIARSLRRWHASNGKYGGPAFTLSAASFQHSTFASCGGADPYSQIPRAGLSNSPDNPACGAMSRVWDRSYEAAASVAWALRRLETDAAVREEVAGELDLLETFARFVQGVAHGSIALHHDQGYVLDERTDTTGLPPLIGYPELMDAALASLGRAADEASVSGFSVPASWIGGIEVSSAELAGIAHALRARFMTAVARTPVERAAVRWGEVVTELNAARPWEMALQPFEPDGWTLDIRYYLAFAGWQQLTYWILGMADQSETYQAWVRVPVADRRPEIDGEPFLIITPDQRFAQGATLDEQTADSHERRPRYGIPPFDVSANFQRPERGTWRWSYYWTYDLENHFDSDRWPEISRAELDLLRAEALYRLNGNAPTPEAAALVDRYRTAAGLDPSGDGNDDCVPRLPDGSCGDFLEMLKWEKRIETQFRGMFGTPWYFDGRGWGDLYHGTFLHLPIPCHEAQERALPCTTFGGPDAPHAAPSSTYAWPTEP